MALTAAVATAVATVCAAVVVGLPPWAVGAGLLPGLWLVIKHPDQRVLPPPFDTRLLLKVLIGVAVLVYLTNPAGSPEHLRALARGAVIVVVALSLLWPVPPILRFCLLLAAGSLLGADASLSSYGWPVAVLAAAAAVALVALHRGPAVEAAGAAAQDPAPARRRQVGREAAALFAIAGLIGLLAAALFPPPSGGGGGPSRGQRPGRGRPGQEPPYLRPTDRLDAGGRGSGKGDQIVFRVDAASSALWRTLTFDAYDGRTWLRSPELDPSEDGDSFQEEYVFLGPGIGDEPGQEPGAGAGEPLVQKVRVETGYLAVLPAAVRAWSVHLNGEGGAETAEDGSIFPLPSLGRRATYVVDSFLPPSRPDVLRSLGTGPAGAPADVRRHYLEFPALPSRVTALAAEIAADAPTAYDKVAAVQAWMKANTTVKSGTPPLPAGADPIDQFLFVDRAGSSEQAASAAAVMLRSLGVPARLAVGYLPGERSLLGGEFVVRARDAHAWVETWYPGAAWVPFDPAGRFLGSTPADDSLLTRLRHLLGRLWWVLLVAVVVAGAWFARRAVAARRAKRSRPWVTRCYERLNRAGARHGRPRSPHETPSEYSAALAEGVSDERLVRVGELVTVAAYSGREPPPDERAWADGVVVATERSARGRRRSDRRRGPAG